MAKTRRYIRPILVAAAALLIVVGGWVLLQQRRVEENDTAKRPSISARIPTWTELLAAQNIVAEADASSKSATDLPSWAETPLQQEIEDLTADVQSATRFVLASLSVNVNNTKEKPTPPS